MRKFKYVLALLIIYSCSCIAEDSLAVKLDILLADYSKQELFSGAVLLAEDETPVYEKVFGYADWENKIPNNSQTLFNICSITKVFTKTMIKQLEQEGKLKPVDPLSKYLSLYPEETGNKITIDYLLNMKAGLGDYLQNPEFNKNPFRFKTITDFLEMIKDEPLLFEPGTSERYSNSGYVVLGGIIEKVTGKSYEDNLKERILEPYGMKNTYFMRYDDRIPNTAISADIDFSGKKTNAPFHASPSPAGGIFTNIGDMLKFYKGLKESKVLKENFIVAGGTNTWNSIMGHYKNGYTLIILGNFGRMADEIESRFRAILKGEPYPKPMPPVQMKFYRVITENGIEYFKEHFKEILNEYMLRFNDMHLNFFGYQLMEQNNIDLAIDVFKLNAELFPDIPNVYDSLGEAYMKKGNKKLAIENYKKVLDMQPDNQNAKKMLEQLQSK